MKFKRPLRENIYSQFQKLAISNLINTEGNRSQLLLKSLTSNQTKFAVILLFGLVFMNINAFLALIFNLTSLVTLILLGLSIFIIINLFNKKGYGIKFIPFQLSILFFIYFLYVGTVVYLFDPSDLHQNTSLIKLYRNYLSSILIISAFYLGSIYLIVNDGIKLLLKLIMAMFLFTSFMTVIGPLIGIGEIYQNISKSILNSDRDTGLFGNPNEAGVLANYTLVILLACYLYSKKYKLIWLLLTALPIYSAFVTFSKAAIIESILILIMFSIFNIFNIKNIGKINRRYIIIFIGLMLASISFIYINFDDLYNSLAKNQKYRINALLALSEGKLDRNTTSDRNLVFAHAFDKITKSPIFGHGLGSYHRFNDGPLHLGTHNTYLLIQGESGIGGTILFLSIFGSLLIYSFKINNPALKFLIFGIILVFLTNKAFFGHTALKDRVSNGLLGISLALAYLSYYKQGLYLKKT